MALPIAAPERKLKHTRQIDVRIYSRGNGLWEVDEFGRHSLSQHNLKVVFTIWVSPPALESVLNIIPL